MSDTRQDDVEMLLKMNEVTQCLAKRVIRDLRHVIDNVPADNPFLPMFKERYKFFSEAIVDTKDYTSKMQYEIRRQDSEIALLKDQNERLRAEVERLKPGDQYGIPQGG